MSEVGDIETKDLFAVESRVCVDGFFIVIVYVVVVIVDIVMTMMRGSESMLLLLLEDIDGLRVCDTEDGAGQGHGGSCPSSTHRASRLCLFVCLLCWCVRGNCERVKKEREEREGRKKKRKKEKKDGRWGLKKDKRATGRKEESAEMKSKMRVRDARFSFGLAFFILNNGKGEVVG